MSIWGQGLGACLVTGDDGHFGHGQLESLQGALRPGAAEPQVPLPPRHLELLEARAALWAQGLAVWGSGFFLEMLGWG